MRELNNQEVEQVNGGILSTIVGRVSDAAADRGIDLGGVLRSGAREIGSSAARGAAGGGLIGLGSGVGRLLERLGR